MRDAHHSEPIHSSALKCLSKDVGTFSRKFPGICESVLLFRQDFKRFDYPHDMNCSAGSRSAGCKSYVPNLDKTFLGLLYHPCFRVASVIQADLIDMNSQ